MNRNEEYIEGTHLNHFDEKGQAIMVDVGAKADTERVAVTHGTITMNQAVYDVVKSGTAKKGDVLGVARVAGIMAVKRTSDLIPLCHVLLLTHASVEFQMHDETCSIEVFCEVRTKGKTGVEMEALTGTTVTLLTIYDMCKAMDRGMVISGVELLKKDGGKSGLYER